MEKQRVLITVKTYPTLSRKYGETVCTAGVREDGTWVRIYPVPFRRLNEEQQYKKYDWLEVRLVRNTTDPRPETYRPFDSAQPYAETGPVFLHERECTPYATPDLYPPEMPRTLVVIRAYDEHDAIADATLVGKREIEGALEEMLSKPGVAYVHVRNAGYGCFICRVDRAA